VVVWSEAYHACLGIELRTSGFKRRHELQQLLWIETLLKLAGGLSLLLAPTSIVRLFGLPATGATLWPRLLGAVLLGLSAATYIEGAWPGSRGLGLVGCIVINLAAAASITAVTVLGGGADTRRGHAALWLLVTILVLLVFFEIAEA
jgi:hypothetical protein